MPPEGVVSSYPLTMLASELIGVAPVISRSSGYGHPVPGWFVHTPQLLSFPAQVVIELSGGNQQKVILGRWTSSKMTTKVLILDEPTKGIDVGTKAEVYQIICDFAKQGIGVIFISSELTEVINLADNIVVMHNGHITGRMKREEATEENVLALAMLD